MEKTYKGSGGQSLIPCPTILGVSLVLIGLQHPPLWHAVPSTSNLVTLPPPQAIGPFVYIIKFSAVKSFSFALVHYCRIHFKHWALNHEFLFVGHHKLWRRIVPLK